MWIVRPKSRSHHFKADSRLSAWIALFSVYLFTWGGLVASSGAQAHAAEAIRIESHGIEADGESGRVVTDLVAFDESPLENPDLVKQVQDGGFDHVVVVDESVAEGSANVASDPLETVVSSIETQTDKPVVRLQLPKGFLAKMRSAWDLSFKHPERVAKKADYRYGIISTLGESGPFAVMILTSKGVAIENALALIAMQSVLSYYTNVWNNGFNHFLESNFNNPGKTVKERTFFLRKFGYEYLTSQLFKLVQSPSMFLSASVQSNVAMNTVMVGAGDVVLSNAMYQAYKGSPEKLAKMNFYVNAISNVLGALDLVQHTVMPVIFNVHAYEFRLSGAILIGYYAAVNRWIQKNPEGIYEQVDRLDRTLKSAGKWISARFANCKSIFGGKKKKEPSETAQLPLILDPLESVIVRELFGLGRAS